ncbi:MAG: hypothetical protein ABIO61_03275 [Thermomonas sp.]
MNSRIVGALIGWLLLVGVAQAQVEEIEAPITATATPVLGLPGAAIKLAGETPAAQPGAKVSLVITITPTPQQAGGDTEPLKREALIDASGRWSLTLKETAAVGRYSVVVIAPDGKGHAKTQFDIAKVDQYVELARKYALAMKLSVNATIVALDGRMEELIQGLPEGTEKAETRRRYTIIRRKLVAIINHPPIPIPLPPSPPGPPGPPGPDPTRDPPPIDPIIDATEESDRIRAAIKASRFGAETCQRLDTIVEALNFTSTLMNFVGKPIDIMLAHLSDKVNPAVIEEDQKLSTEDKFIKSEKVKVAVAALRGSKSLVNSVPGLAFDLANYVTKDFYGKVCTRFEGPFTGTLSIEYYTTSTSRDAYWSYIIKIGGMMSLSQPKYFNGLPGSIMIGRVDGAAIGYEVSEDTLKLIPAMRDRLMYRKLIAPRAEIPLPPIEMGALFNTMAHPLGFQSTMRGVRKGDQVVVNFDEPALRDMDPKFNRALLIHVFNGGLIPVLNYQTLPMQGGHYILTRGMRKDAVLNLTTEGKEQHLKNKFTRKEDTGDISLRWDVEVDLCNPACSTTTIRRVKAWWDAGEAKRKKE